MKHGTVVGLLSPAGHASKKLLAGRAMRDHKHTIVLRPGHNTGQRRDHARPKLAFRLATKGHRIIAPGLRRHIAI